MVADHFSKIMVAKNNCHDFEFNHQNRKANIRQETCHVDAHLHQWRTASSEQCLAHTNLNVLAWIAWLPGFQILPTDAGTLVMSIDGESFATETQLFPGLPTTQMMTTVTAVTVMMMILFHHHLLYKEEFYHHQYKCRQNQCRWSVPSIRCAKTNSQSTKLKSTKRSNDAKRRLKRRKRATQSVLCASKTSRPTAWWHRVVTSFAQSATAKISAGHFSATLTFATSALRAEPTGTNQTKCTLSTQKTSQSVHAKKRVQKSQYKIQQY